MLELLDFFVDLLSLLRLVVVRWRFCACLFLAGLGVAICFFIPPGDLRTGIIVGIATAGVVGGFVWEWRARKLRDIPAGS
jgi:hypothetical protein